MVVLILIPLHIRREDIGLGLVLLVVAFLLQAGPLKVIKLILLRVPFHAALMIHLIFLPPPFFGLGELPSSFFDIFPLSRGVFEDLSFLVGVNFRE